MFITAHDSLYYDNTDPDGDFAVRVTVLPGVPGDYNDNGVVEAADYVVSRENGGTTNVLPNDLIGGVIGAAFQPMACQLRPHGQWRPGIGQLRLQKCCRARAGNAGAADVCGGWLVSPARPGRIESSINSSTRDTVIKPPI